MKMNRRIIALLMVLLLASGMALAESDYAYFPVIEDYAGVWSSDDFVLEIVHMYDDYNLLGCVITQTTGDQEGVRWIYDNCSYDDVGKALTSLETGVKFTIELDDGGELLSNEDIYLDGAASFALNDDGTLTWTDFKEMPGENERVFKKVSDGGRSPEENFGGCWTCGRAAIDIEFSGDAITCTVTWGGSAWEVVQWVYDCVYKQEGNRLVAPATGVKTILTFGDDGAIASEEQIYDDGEAVFTLEGLEHLSWEDRKENAGEDMMFEKG